MNDIKNKGFLSAETAIGIFVLIVCFFLVFFFLFDNKNSEWEKESKDISKIGNLSGFSTASFLFFTENNFSYIGICEKQKQKNKKEIIFNVVCRENQNSFIIFTELFSEKHQNYFCIDSTGFKGQINIKPKYGDFSC